MNNLQLSDLNNSTTKNNNNNNHDMNGGYYYVCVVCVCACADKPFSSNSFYLIFTNIVSLVNLVFTTILLYNIIKKVFSRVLRYQSTMLGYQSTLK